MWVHQCHTTSSRTVLLLIQENSPQIKHLYYRLVSMLSWRIMPLNCLWHRFLPLSRWAFSFYLSNLPVVGIYFPIPFLSSSMGNLFSFSFINAFLHVCYIDLIFSICFIFNTIYFLNVQLLTFHLRLKYNSEHYGLVHYHICYIFIIYILLYTCVCELNKLCV